jgi:hypothetical protein
MTSVICLQLVWSALYIGLMFGASSAQHRDLFEVC